MTETSGSLVRTIGRWSLAALMVNTMIGASIFGLPSVIAGYLGRMSPLGYLVAGTGVAVIAACLAEVASQFQEAGGPYLYARAAFGQFVAIQIGWLTWLSRISAASAVANLFITYLSEFFPSVSGGVLRTTILAMTIGFLAGVNYRGVKIGNWLSNFFTITKVALLVFFLAAGLVALFLHANIGVIPARVDVTWADWVHAVILMIYAYSGFEAALFASGEARNIRKDVPIALLAALTSVTLLYVAMQYVVIHTLPNAAASGKPAVDAARHFLSPLGVTLVTMGTLVSVYGYLSAGMLHTPRLTFAMGRQGDFPAFFAAVHPRFRSPYVSIITFAALVIAFSVGGSFRWNATLSAVSRLFVYGCIAAALPALRKKQPGADAFRLPGGMLFPVLALVFTGVLITQMHLREVMVIAITFTMALVNWLFVRGGRKVSPAK
ncbi:MAG TPA: amino acid permease [Candidatus Dormibacteraeota bacterium]|nr:amino acid permease [Candidatus Dormibacteraeota bacterium]